MNPDADGLGSMVVGKRLCQFANPNAKVDMFADYNEKELLGRYRYLFKSNSHNELDPPNFLDKYDLCIAHDCANEKRLGKYLSIFKSGKVTANVDHHDNDKFALLNYINTDASSTCEMMYDIINAQNIEITRGMAAILYGGVITDTGDFTHNCTAHTHEMISNLYNIANPQRVKEIFNDSTPEGMKLLRACDMDFYFDNRLVIIKVSQDQIRQSGAKMRDTYGMSDRGAAIRRVDISMAFVESEQGLWHCSLRANGDHSIVDLARMNGGGHSSHRVGAFTTNRHPDEAICNMLPLIEHLFERQPHYIGKENPFIDDQPLRTRE